MSVSHTEEGSQPFYHGDLAQKMVSYLQPHGTLITLQDLAQYR